MHQLRFAAVAALATWAIAPRADAQSWKIGEVFSNSAGTIQFIELTTTAVSDFSLNGLSLTAMNDGVPTVFNFTHDLSGQPTTLGRSLLIATPTFSSLTGAVTPDFATLPTGFFNPNAGSISLDFAGVETLSFTGAMVPKNGVASLRDHLPAGTTPHLAWETNSPTNFAGAAGSINLVTQPLAGDFDGSGTVNDGDLFLWRLGYGFTNFAAPLDGDADGDQDVDGADYLLWQRNYGVSQVAAAAGIATSGAVPEPTAGAMALGAAAALVWARRRTAK